ncbi:Hypothetical protein PAB1821 [Pyrococcus abyssi GE5]|uniref:Uncharacterized protein n=1 Tax=Pyrococcus abyssi (strain GE5 / Orsay) TaxID=272844 RepID=Q9V0H6_PYRAB|nr:Hypothetical protein PAB1821 [Pyrococcus abyssi GE5]CCE70214.1 TPA: hypothetical protein PAB1821 [Pyrococcus abyssi GE5]
MDCPTSMTSTRVRRVRVKDSIEVALELNEKSVYSHIAHESAEDIKRIISSMDAERAKLRGEVVYHQDDWDALIRERIRKGKRHTAFDFYNPLLLDIWEKKVKEAKKALKFIKYSIGIVTLFIGATIVITMVSGYPAILLGLGIAPILLFIVDYSKEKADLAYYELVQFFIHELKGIIERFQLNSKEYKVKLYNRDYDGVEFDRSGKAIVK